MGVRLYRMILQVGDIERATEFYSYLLEMPGQRISPSRHYFNCGGTIIVCFDPVAAEYNITARPLPDCIYLAVTDLETAHERAKTAGCLQLDDSINTMPWGERSFYAADPFGNPFCMVDEATIYVAG